MRYPWAPFLARAYNLYPFLHQNLCGRNTSYWSSAYYVSAVHISRLFPFRQDNSICLWGWMYSHCAQMVSGVCTVHFTGWGAQVYASQRKTLVPFSSGGIWWIRWKLWYHLKNWFVLIFNRKSLQDRPLGVDCTVIVHKQSVIPFVLNFNRKSQHDKQYPLKIKEEEKSSYMFGIWGWLYSHCEQMVSGAYRLRCALLKYTQASASPWFLSLLCTGAGAVRISK